MKKTISTVALESKVAELHKQFHGQNQAAWDRLKLCIMSALASALSLGAETRNEIRELFLTLWDKAVGSSNVEQTNLWNEVQFGLQLKGIIF